MSVPGKPAHDSTQSISMCLPGSMSMPLRWFGPNQPVAPVNSVHLLALIEN